MVRLLVSSALMAMLGMVSFAATATPIAIYNTGAGSATPGNADPNWTITSTPTSSSGATAYVVSTQPTGWVSGTSTSQWISPSAIENPNTPGFVSPTAGLYTYQTTFDLTGFSPWTASLNGQFGADDCLMSIVLNGHTVSNYGTGGVCTSWGSFVNFAIGSAYKNDFLAGSNTLQFIVKQSAGTSRNPSGLNVRVQGTVSVPEPGELGLFGLGLLGLLGLGLRRRIS